jgi:hypothetical protein
MLKVFIVAHVLWFTAAQTAAWIAVARVVSQSAAHVERAGARGHND